MRWLPYARLYAIFNENLSIYEVCDQATYVWTYHYALALRSKEFSLNLFVCWNL